MAKQFAVKERDGSIHGAASRKEAEREQRAYGGMLVSTDRAGTWKPYKRHRVFWWIFLAIQVGFILWIITGATSNTNPTAVDIARWCGNGNWSPLYHSYEACVANAGRSLRAAQDFGKGIGVSIIVIIWVIIDFLLAVIYGIYRLARR